LKRYAIQFYAIAARNGEQDISRTDYALVRQLTEHGKSVQDIVATLISCSPNIQVRHQHSPDDYISRTITAATKERKNGNYQRHV
jgi:hypothetical protein